MLVEKTIIINISNGNIKHYKTLGYDVYFGDEIEIPIEHLPKGSHKLIIAKCMDCGKEKEIAYRDHKIDYRCRKCAEVKRKKTCVEKYGCEYPAQNEDVIKKTKQTNIEKYGCVCAMNCDEIKEKIIEKNQKNYGCDWGLSSEIIKEKSKKTCIEKYGVENVSQSEEIKEKKRKNKI